MLPKIIDLFSGCGGLALGFEKAGFDVVAGVELMPEACKTISYNLDYRYGREKTHLCADITKLDASIFSNSFGEEGCIVIGGPPCQAYSLAGRAKLRSLGEDRINTNDARGYLYQDFLRFAYDLDAKAVIMENVPESTCYGEMNIPEIVCDSLIEHGYDAYWTLLNSADYGVPQLRERIFVIAKKKTLGKEIRLPIPSNKCTYEYKTRNQKKMDLFRKSKHFYMPNSSEKAIYPWVTVGDALSDLPILFPNSKSKYRNVKLNEEMDYRCDPKNEFQDLMRNWYGTESFGSSANAFRNTKRDFAIFEKMNQGDDYVAAHQIAEKMFESEVRVFGYKKDSNDYKALHKKMVPVYDTNKFERKWLKLNEKRPSHTIVAHLCKDTYSHIHPVEPRGISVREAARIQSFPDDFYFSCSMGDAYKQIGNAVPPLLAFAVADKVYDSFAEV